MLSVRFGDFLISGAEESAHFLHARRRAPVTGISKQNKLSAHVRHVTKSILLEGPVSHWLSPPLTQEKGLPLKVPVRAPRTTRYVARVARNFFAQYAAN